MKKGIKKLVLTDKSVEKIDNKSLIPAEVIENKILMIRGHKVMLDNDLAQLYGVETKYLKRAVKRNIFRFPPDFMFKLNKEEQNIIRCHFGTLRWGKHTKYLMYVFTEQGVAMLSSVLKSKRAVLVNIAIMRAFVKLRQLMSTNKELVQKLYELERKLEHHDSDIIAIFSAIRQIMKEEKKPKNRIRFL